jgi:hypothetical protein
MLCLTATPVCIIKCRQQDCYLLDVRAAESRSSAAPATVVRVAQVSSTAAVLCMLGLHCVGLASEVLCLHPQLFVPYRHAGLGSCCLQHNSMHVHVCASTA